MFKLSISNIAWHKEDEEKVLDLLLLNGFQGIEIAPASFIQSENPYEVDEDTVKDLLQKIQRKHLEISSMQSLLYGYKDALLFDSGIKRSNLLIIIKKSIHLASMLGIGNIVFGSPKNRIIPEYMPINEAENIATDFFYTIAEYAKTFEVSIGLEANAKDYGCNFITSTKDALIFIKKLNHSNFRLNYDLGTDILNNTIPNISEEDAKYISHVHIALPLLDKIDFIEKYEIFHKELYKVLKMLNYNKYVSIEMKAVGTIDDIIDSINVIKQHYKR